MSKTRSKKTRDRKTPTGVFSRSVQLFSMAGRVAAKELGTRILPGDVQKKLQQKVETRIEQARVIAESLSHLKGAAMKAGQLLSLDTTDFLPPEAVEILSRLQAQATPARTDELQGVLTHELGPEKIARIRNFSPNPVASASIGQVHSAEIDGQRVAIKIQYPGVSESIDSDLAILRKLAGGFVTLSGKKFSLDELFAEIRGVLIQEVDYENERANLDRYRDQLASSVHYVVPRSFAEFSTRRVLTMSFEDGAPIITWAQNPHTGLQDRTHIARLMLDLFCLEFCDWGMVQTDPNFANYLVRDNKLVCLDFGATLVYSPEFRRGYAHLLRSIASNDTETIFRNAVEFGLLDPRESFDAQEAFKDMLQVAMEPFRPDHQPFRFSDPEYEKRTVKANRRFVRQLIYSPPPRKIMFLHRKLGGMFSLMKRLGAEFDLLPYWQKMSTMDTTL